MYDKLLLGTSVLLLLAIFTNGETTIEIPMHEYLRFPSNFLLGAASAAYQIEGGWNASDKGESTWDRFTHDGRVFNDDTGDIAADSYHKYKEDVAILKSLGLKAYRFSVSWPRILPTGFSNKISKDGLQYYHNLIDELLRNDIEPILTIYHWDHPQSIEDLGGWLNSEIVDWFGDYARIVFREFGTKVKKFIPINEPLVICKGAYSMGFYAPGKTLHGIGEYLCVHNMLKAHARSYRIYESEFKESQKGEVGFLVNLFAYMPETDEDEYAAYVSFQFNVGWTMHPIYSKEGDYPAVMKSLVANKSKEQGYPRSRLPTFDAYWIEYLRGTSDFLAVNHYTARLVTSGTMGKEPSHENDQGVLEFIDNSWKGAGSEWLKVVPEGFRYILRQLAENYGNPRMYITENGVSDNGTLEDDDRIFYYREYLKQMLLAIYIDGVNVQGYLLWTILDDFEWNMGYSEHFGIVSVDFNDPNRPRKLKKSASWWKRVVAARKIEE